MERQLERRAQRARKRKQLTIAGSVIGVVVVVAAVGVVVSLTRGDDPEQAASPETTAGVLPASRAEPLPDTVSCTYAPDGQPPAREVQAPRTEGIETTLETVSVSMTTSQGNVGLTLQNSDSPCTVNNFLSLASQHYFDGTPCHRLTTGDALRVLQCGDPTGTGTGGPGYGFANEFPTDQYDPSDPAAQSPVTYPRGTIAMANTGQPNSNGSQFFLVYGDSQLPPQYTVFGTVDETGLETLDKIAAGGSDNANGPGDGKPNTPVDLTTVLMD
nr:peptidylprolyl isomerase [Rhodococcus sp. HNM0569]